MTLKSIILTSLAALAFTSAAGQQPEPVLTEVLFRKGDAGVHTYRIPSLIQAADGSIVAFAEARQNGGGDTGDIDLVARRSTDGGKTWGEIITVWDDGENVCGNPCPVVGNETSGMDLVCNRAMSCHPAQQRAAQRQDSRPMQSRSIRKRYRFTYHLFR